MLANTQMAMHVCTRFGEIRLERTSHMYTYIYGVFRSFCWLLEKYLAFLEHLTYRAMPTDINMLIAEFLMGPIRRDPDGPEDEFDEQINGPGVIALTMFSWCRRQGCLIFGMRRYQVSQYLTDLN